MSPAGKPTAGAQSVSPRRKEGGENTQPLQNMASCPPVKEDGDKKKRRKACEMCPGCNQLERCGDCGPCLGLEAAKAAGKRAGQCKKQKCYMLKYGLDGPVGEDGVTIYCVKCGYISDDEGEDGDDEEGADETKISEDDEDEEVSEENPRTPPLHRRF